MALAARRAMTARRPFTVAQTRAAFAGTSHDKDDVVALMVTLAALMTLMDADHRDNVYNMAK